MKDKALTEGEIKARLAQAEVHFSHYRWDDALTTFEAILAGQPDHPAAAQGWANAVEQKSIDEELSQALAKARTYLASHRFDEALSLLNHAQTRGALSHILKYHSEIDGLRSEAQEGHEWQRRIETATHEAEALAGRRRYDQAVEVLDNALRPLNARGWERLGAKLAALRDTLIAERDVSERIQFAQAAYERQDYGLAAELAAVLHEELPGREDVRRLHERAHAAWGRIQERLAAVHQAQAEDRTDDALALLASLRAEHPRNPDWQAIALRVHMDQGRAEIAKGRAAMVEQAFQDAAEAFEGAYVAFTATAEIFSEHPTAGQEQREAEALGDAALFAGQAAHDQAAFRWEATRQGWKTSREHLSRAMATRGRDFGEVAAVVDGKLGEAETALADLEQARLMLADGRQALDARDAGSAREAFRAGLACVEGGRLGPGSDLNELREGLAAGLRDAERVQRDVKKLLSQAEAAGGRDDQRLALLRRAHERWETAPGLAARLAEELLKAAAGSAEVGDEDSALGYCEEAGEVLGAPAGALAEAARLAADVRQRRAARVAQAEAAERHARAEAVGQALAPAIQALQEVDASFAAAEGGELDEVDWEMAGRALSRAHKALAMARKLPPPLPPQWEELRGRVDSQERRCRLLQRSQEQAAEGHGIEAIPALQAFMAREPDAVVHAVLERLLHESAGAAGSAARHWQTDSAAALERGELTTAEAYLELARSYASASPREVPQIRRIERQLGLLGQVREATREARARTAAGDLNVALACYRNALELATDGEAGLPPEARRALNRVLDSNELPEEPPTALLGDAHPLVAEFVAPALGPWLRLAKRTTALARIETAVALGREAAAADDAAALALAYPGDAQVLDAYRRASAGAMTRRLAERRRRLRRAQRLAEHGEPGAALAELARDEELARETEIAGENVELGPALHEVENLANEAARMRTRLRLELSLSEQLAPLLEEMRRHALADEFDMALAVRDRAGFLDPRRLATAFWEELDGLAALVEKRRAEGASASSGMRGVEKRRLHAEMADDSTEQGQAETHAVHQAPVKGPAAEEQRPAPFERDPGKSVSPIEQSTPPEAAGPSEESEPPIAIEPIIPLEPAAPFDLDDWLSNVTELGPEDAGTEDRS